MAGKWSSSKSIDECRPGLSSPGERSCKVSADLVGLCYNCFSDRHLAKFCPSPSCCFHCREAGHQAQDCTSPRVFLSGRPRRPHGSSPLASPGSIERRGAPRSRSPPSDLTPLALSYSMSSEGSPSQICVPPSDSSRSRSSLPSPPRSPTLPPLLPLGAPERHPLVELCIVHCSEEIEHMEQDLNFTLVAMVGG
jgi:hypothetical protein